MDKLSLDAVCVQLANEVAQEASKGLGKKWRCPADLREEIVAYAVACRATGEALAPISERLGLIESTLARWLRRRKERPENRRGFQSVAIVPSAELQRPPCESQLRVITAAGHIIEGLDVKGAAYLLKAIQ